ncbi:uncharacterized protein GGS22DRAFT_192151 [Annulohypoxylon maeteangense]|uniref:uncharacterized protein n=1 Tax=Annulohypoxylon maeteangense TaxID=1927788 RepID=UPI002007FA0A|nr:uncharacterized protein GGS22DRAFT_192151 [Annulohypoxylon maeteangense]KAI0881517.1 hypothetical protein GGS22DRAFT_192151 [Annulohypoxylon maeteangense]
MSSRNQTFSTIGRETPRGRAPSVAQWAMNNASGGRTAVGARSQAGHTAIGARSQAGHSQAGYSVAGHSQAGTSHAGSRAPSTIYPGSSVSGSHRGSVVSHRGSVVSRRGSVVSRPPTVASGPRGRSASVAGVPIVVTNGRQPVYAYDGSMYCSPTCADADGALFSPDTVLAAPSRAGSYAPSQVTSVSRRSSVSGASGMTGTSYRSGSTMTPRSRAMSRAMIPGSNAGSGFVTANARQEHDLHITEVRMLHIRGQGPLPRRF